MAKGIGLIGNFKGKVGNTVGYNLSASNTGSTQGIRIYQPIVRNPKTSAQAEQRAKLAPINATYRALKMVIDRGNEGLPYGNKSRLAWLKQAFKAQNMPWVVKGATNPFPVGCALTKGSLSSLSYNVKTDLIEINCEGVTKQSSFATIGALSIALKAAYPTLKDGDQITIVQGGGFGNNIDFVVFSFLIDATSAVAVTGFSAGDNVINYNRTPGGSAGAVIVSREGATGQHLRSTESLAIDSDELSNPPYDNASKEAAIESYMSSDATNSDWAEESIQ